MSELQERFEDLLENDVQEEIGSAPDIEHIEADAEGVRLDLVLSDPFSGEMRFSLYLDGDEARKIDGPELARRVDDLAQNSTFDGNAQFPIDDDDTIHPA